MIEDDADYQLHIVLANPQQVKANLRNFIRRRKQVIAAAAQYRDRCSGCSKTPASKSVRSSEISSVAPDSSCWKHWSRVVAATFEIAQLAPGTLPMQDVAFPARDVEEVDKRDSTSERKAGLTESWQLLRTIPGIRETAAAAILAEGAARGNHESARVRNARRHRIGQKG